jgi:O-antigen/teichoic acid export membrane protein
MASIRGKYPWSIRGAKLDQATSTVARQGAGVLAANFAYSGLGFAFWALAARLFSEDQVGFAAALVSLSFLASTTGVLGLDYGLVRFLATVARPRRLIAQVLLITSASSGVFGFGLSLYFLTVWNATFGDLYLLVGLSVFLTVSQSWLGMTDAAMIAAGKSQLVALRAFAFGAIKVAALVIVLWAGVAGILAAYGLPALLVVLGTLFLIPRLWPRQNATGTPQSLRQVASLSAGNWVSQFAYSLPNRVGPFLILLFVDARSVAFFFIALQLADVLNYGSDAISRSLIAHASREGRLDRSLTKAFRKLLILIVVPLIAIAFVAAPFAMSVIGGPSYRSHALSLQLFLLAVLPKTLYGILRAQFNVERRSLALVIAGGSFGFITLAALLIGLFLDINPDLLPVSWVVGAVAGLAVSHYLAGWRLRPRDREGRPTMAQGDSMETPNAR